MVEAASIHSSAAVHPSARLGAGVEVAAFAFIGADVEIGANSRIGPHAVIFGPTRIGDDNVIHAHACLGGAPQDRSYRGEASGLEIGARNEIREFVTMHRGSAKDRGCTRLGDDGFFMVHSHVAHDCALGNGVTMANAATLAGHVSVGDGAVISGLCTVHQFARIGRHAMIGGNSAVSLDVPPYMLASGDRARLYGLNRRGLERAGFDAPALGALKRAYRVLHRPGRRLADAVAAIRAAGDLTTEVEHLLDFMETSRRGVLR